MSVAHGKWRPGARKTHCKRGHEFTPENTRYSPEGWKSCKACDRIRYENAQTPRTVTCPDCGYTREIKRGDRPDRVHDAGLCQRCAARRRGYENLAPQLVEATEGLRQWWLDNYSLDEIRSLAAGLGEAV